MRGNTWEGGSVCAVRDLALAVYHLLFLGPGGSKKEMRHTGFIGVVCVG